jgi:hypothetical protein
MLVIRKFFDVLHGMECRCRRKMRSVLALLRSQVSTTTEPGYVCYAGSSLTAVSVRHVVSAWVLTQLCYGS